MTDRYAFDARHRAEDGWAQCDTAQDAGYFGIWCNARTRQIYTYCEGDITIETADDAAAFAAAVRRAAAFYVDGGHGFKIDALFNDALNADFVGAGLEDLLH